MAESQVDWKFWHYPARRLGVSVAVGLFTAFFLWLPCHLPWLESALGGWTALALTFACWTWIVLWRFTPGGTRDHAGEEGPRHVWAVFGLILLGAVASLAGVWYLIRSDHQLAWLAVSSVVLSWFTIHTLYALIYAKHFYDRVQGGGIDFNSPLRDAYEPCYVDFFYLAFAIGMSFAIPDTNLTLTRMRKTALGQGLLSFVFSAVIIAAVVNLLSGTSS